MSTRAGFVALAGRPNVGKSTLTNAIVGAKVAIVSARPQTTRRAIRGVATGADWQLVLVDLPGVQRPRDALTERMAHRVDAELADADAALVIVNGEEGIGPGDRYIVATLAATNRPVTIAVNKMDRLSRPRQTQALVDAAALAPDAAEVFPISARAGSGIAALVEHLVGQLPESPFLYEPAQRSDQSQQELLAELIREQVLKRTFQELPHAVGVVIDEIGGDGELTRIDAVTWVETESQKAIVIGHGGRMIKAIGTAARRELERELATRVHLNLLVRVRRNWRSDDSLLDRLGIE
ncbi:MAG: GTPase Era [Solirubrobacteraceae bacterium]